MRRFSGAVLASMAAGGLAMAWALVATLPAAAVPAPRGCKRGPVLVVHHRSATAAVYSAPHGGAGLCAVVDSSASFTASWREVSRATVPAKAIQVFAAGAGGSPGVVVLFGRVGARVTAVTIERSSHFAPEHAHVAHGWYVALWTGAPHKTHATKVRITADSITRTFPLPAADREGVPGCPGPGSNCASIGPGQTVGP